VLGFSALKAGLVLAPMSLVGMVLAPVAGKMSDRVGGKYILTAGLTLFALGSAWVVASAGVGTSWPRFLPGVLVMGLGFGGIFAPMATEAMRSVPAQLAGAAAGVNNTIRQVGSVIGSAAVGALLQNQLASSLHIEAVHRAGELPADVRSGFIAGFDGGKGGLEVGASQAQAALPSGLPAAAVQHVQQVAAAVFQHGYVRALHPTMALPIAAMLIAALTCLLAQGRAGTTRAAASRAAAAEAESNAAESTGVAANGAASNGAATGGPTAPAEAHPV
jgi:MFS family permease